MNNFEIYLKEIEKAFKSHIATEHTYRHALIKLIESFGSEYQAINEPKRRTFGAPDYVIRKREIPVGYIEAKDVGKDLDKFGEREKEQLKKYLDSLNNIIYTNYLDFRWYVRGAVVAEISLAEFDAKGTLRPNADAELQFTNLIKEFLVKEVPTVATAKELAQRMASITRLIRQTIEKALEDEETAKDYTLHEQFESFQKTLLPNLKQDEFADMYSQTIAYGLFTARCFDNTPPFTRQKAAYLLPKTNPFLRETFDRIAGIHLDERITWAVDDLAELLNRTDISAILQDFGKRTRQEDPVVHFYETFLAEYDPKMREARGVYYTPEPVVSYIVRSVDKILQNDFGLPKGLADSSKLTDGTHKVLILDPATGTGTFLYSVIKNIFKRFEKNRGMWDGYVSTHLLPRIFGFELLVAPYAVAHLKLGLLLEETGYKFNTNERLRIYLNNTLDFVALKEEKPDAFSAFINREASAAREIQQDKPVMVVLGNPPYEEESKNNGLWIMNLLRGSDSLNNEKTDNYFSIDDKSLNEKNSKSLNNDYVKFIRFAQWRIDQTGYGILAFITSNTYLDTALFRGMRQSLMQTFDDIYILDLHGSVKRKEKHPDGSKDVNVFDIQQGVAIGIFIKKKKEIASSAPNSVAKISHADLYGVRENWTKNENDELESTGGKYHWLWKNDIETTEWKEINPEKPFYLFAPQNTNLLDEYKRSWRLKDIFLVSTNGFVSSRDHFAIDIDKAEIKNRISNLRENKISDSEINKIYELGSWNVAKVRKALRNEEDWELDLIKCNYRPFDNRFCYFSNLVFDRPRRELLDHVANKSNLCLGIGRQGIAVNDDQWALITISRFPIDKNVFRRGGVDVTPLYLYPTEKEKIITTFERLPNLSDEFLTDFASKLNLEFLSDGKGDLIKTFAPEDIFNYAYAVFHSPTYRARYSEFLKIDFPRLPLTSNVVLFRQLVALGSRLVELHLLEKDIETDVIFPEKGSNQVESIRYKITGATGWLNKEGQHFEQGLGEVWINQTQYFANVPETAWNFHIGGYQVLHKWLKDRKGRTLAFDDLEHYAKVVSALLETIELMQKIDEAIEETGGFPIE